jgi:hypothetical protein
MTDISMLLFEKFSVNFHHWINHILIFSEMNLQNLMIREYTDLFSEFLENISWDFFSWSTTLNF